jgi:hypothetical protein
MNVAAALACSVCFGGSKGSMIDGARLGVWLLLGVTIVIQGGFAAFFFYLRRRARQAAAAEVGSVETS